MQVLTDYNEIFDRIEPLLNEDYFKLLDIKPCTATGYFFRNRGPELVDFCNKHPEYHILSTIEGLIYVNRFVSNALFYNLAIGDPNPDLIIIPKSDPVVKFDLEIAISEANK